MSIGREHRKEHRNIGNWFGESSEREHRKEHRCIGRGAGQEHRKEHRNIGKPFQGLTAGIGSGEFAHTNEPDLSRSRGGAGFLYGGAEMSEIPETPNPTWVIAPQGLSDDELMANQAIALRVLGCTCEPEITFERDHFGPEVHRFGIAHDEWCPLLIRKERERRRMVAGDN